MGYQQNGMHSSLAWKIAASTGQDANDVRMALENRVLDEQRPLRVICVGAGISGIYAAMRFPHSFSNVTLQLYEKNGDFGGTWLENRYAGCACDIPAHAYQLHSEPNPNWTSFYAPAREIFAYWKGLALKYNVDKVTKFKHEVVRSVFDEDKQRWIVTVKDRLSDAIFVDEADVIIQASGSLNAWKWPEVEGLQSFKGQLLHSAVWSESLNFSGKRVALIGSGSTAIQILPALAPQAAKIDQYVRSPTWIAPAFSGEEIAARGEQDEARGNFSYTDDEKEIMAKDPKACYKYRHRIMTALNSVHSITQLGSKAQENARAATEAAMRQKLKQNMDIADFLIPPFALGCRRITPGAGYLEAFNRPNVDMIRGAIQKVTPEGIVDASGELREYDIIVCATGFNTSYTPRYPIIGRDAVSMSDRWAKFPESYLSLALDGFPNYFIVNGPNSAVGTGDLLIVFQTEIDYIIKCIRKLQVHNYKTIEVTPEALRDFQEYSQSYFKQTVFGTKCPTWYKAGNNDGPVYALWPGSALHAVKTLMHPRWEDYTFTNVASSNKNRFAYLGNGSTKADHGDDDAAWYVTVPSALHLQLGQADAADPVKLLLK